MKRNIFFAIGFTAIVSTLLAAFCAVVGVSGTFGFLALTGSMPPEPFLEIVGRILAGAVGVAIPFGITAALIGDLQ